MKKLAIAVILLAVSFTTQAGTKSKHQLENETLAKEIRKEYRDNNYKKLNKSLIRKCLRKPFLSEFEVNEVDYLDNLGFYIYDWVTR